MSVDCLAAYSETPELCFLAPYMQAYIQTPFFMFNSKYDAWQIREILEVPCFDAWATHSNCSASDQAAILQYGADFMSNFDGEGTGVPVEGHGRNGAFVTSCIMHGALMCDADISINNLTALAAYARWFDGRTQGVASFHIDPGLPNGGGTYPRTQCFHFP